MANKSKWICKHFSKKVPLTVFLKNARILAWNLCREKLLKAFTIVKCLPHFSFETQLNIHFCLVQFFYLFCFISTIPCYTLFWSCFSFSFVLYNFLFLSFIDLSLHSICFQFDIHRTSRWKPAATVLSLYFRISVQRLFWEFPKAFCRFEWAFPLGSLVIKRSLIWTCLKNKRKSIQSQ